MKRISKTKALEAIQSSKGKFFSTTFTTKDGRTRTLNGKLQGISKLGYIRMSVLEKGKPAIKQANLQTMSKLSINKETYRVAT